MKMINNNHIANVLIKTLQSCLTTPTWYSNNIAKGINRRVNQFALWVKMIRCTILHIKHWMVFYLTILHISHRTLNIKWYTCVWDNVGTWHLQEVDPLNSGEEENENKNWHFFFHQVTFSLDIVPSFHFYFFGSFLVTDEVIFKQQGAEPE